MCAGVGFQLAHQGAGDPTAAGVRVDQNLGHFGAVGLVGGCGHDQLRTAQQGTVSGGNKQGAIPGGDGGQDGGLPKGAGFVPWVGQDEPDAGPCMDAGM